MKQLICDRGELLTIDLSRPSFRNVPLSPIFQIGELAGIAIGMTILMNVLLAG